MTTETNVVSVKNLNVHYGKLHAVRGISFEIPKGEVFGFIGPNGAGKSSTIRVLATLQKKFTGQVCVNGIEVRENPDRIREMIGFMPDFFGVYEDLTAREYLHFFAAAYRLPKDRRHSTVSDVLELTDLTHKIDSPVDSLSRGMKQRLALARVLLHDPDLLLLDEPASGLDPRARIEVRELLKAMQEMGKTILISSHILHELAQLCTRIGIIEAGQLVAEGSLNEIFQQLSLKRVVHVQIVKLSDEALKEMEQIPGIDSVERHTDRVAIRLREDELAVEDLHSELVRLGCKIRMFQPEAMDMETAFMKLTEGVTA
ncbi:putative ABC transporter ATP-binding protein YbhF [Thalassoglobus neptunius]|uniref:Putative ABC transporter ATP-binding protein YbhF n=1 Tax=Thalassoglobus neptunius TaxID=1938619 RepID=A0A5C5X3T7_9PLAN|nr:ABC transporter ATP-binding protein [Thalassoglobus neptunius]TWT57468.1 putative ABC transporter ATP-binding protein YbhF [Thalassoglobus neptunius]